MKKLSTLVVVLILAACGSSTSIDPKFQGMWEVVPEADRATSNYEVITANHIYNFDGNGCIPLGSLRVENGVPSFGNQKYQSIGLGLINGEKVLVKASRNDRMAASLRFVPAGKLEGYFANPASLVRDFCCPNIGTKTEDCK